MFQWPLGSGGIEIQILLLRPKTQYHYLWLQVKMVIPANFIYLRKLRQSMLVPKSGFGMLTINILNNRIVFFSIATTSLILYCIPIKLRLEHTCCANSQQHILVWIAYIMRHQCIYWRQVLVILKEKENYFLLIRWLDIRCWSVSSEWPCELLQY